MNRKLLLALSVLLLLFALKYAFGQDDTSGVGWDPIAIYPAPDYDIFHIMLAAPIVGVLYGIKRVVSLPHAPPVLNPLSLK
jgi:ABC-type uncharacterized transport system permease subunit